MQSTLNTLKYPMQKSGHKIFLVGLMGAGKTTIGKQLAQMLGYTFLDSDHEIEAHTGASIPLIFELEGEQGFRERETKMIDRLSQQNNIVMATGGGAVLREENRRMLVARGIVVYLAASLDQLYNRTRRDKNRPLLQTGNPRDKLASLIEEREPLYKAVADITVDTGRGNIKSTANYIKKQIQALTART